MKQISIVNMRQAKTHLSRLVNQASKGEPFIIAKAGKPLVRVVPVARASRSKIRRVGLLKGFVSVPDDFDRMEHEEIERSFKDAK